MDEERERVGIGGCEEWRVRWKEMDEERERETERERDEGERQCE